MIPKEGCRAIEWTYVVVMVGAKTMSGTESVTMQNVQTIVLRLVT